MINLKNAVLVACLSAVYGDAAFMVSQPAIPVLIGFRPETTAIRLPE
jgi:hypothetical protein